MSEQQYFLNPTHYYCCPDPNIPPSNIVYQQPVESYVPPTEEVAADATSYSKWSIIVGLFIIVIIVLGFFFAFYYLFRTESDFKRLIAQNTTGQSCSAQTCGNGFYCDGNGICRPGSGEGVGESCSKDADCTFGLKCLSGSKVCGTDPGTTPVSNFTNKQLITTINGTKQYLIIDSSGSFLSSTKPNQYSFDYDSTNGLSFNTELPLVSTRSNLYTDKFVGFGPDGELVISKTPTKLQLDQTGNSDIQLVNPVCKENIGGQPLFWNNNDNSTSNQSEAVTSEGINGINETTIGTTGNNSFFVQNEFVRNDCVIINEDLFGSSGIAGSLNSGMNSGMNSVIDKPFIAYFPVPSNNTSLPMNQRCPSTWRTINGANVITFNLEDN